MTGPISPADDGPAIAPIRTARLDLEAVLPAEYQVLAVDRSDPRLWVDRGFGNPHRHLVDDPGPLPYRIPRIAEHPERAPYLLRMAVHRQARVIIGSAGFHSVPDADGMIEIGLEVVPAWRGQGLAKEMLHGMWGWVVQQPGVRTLRYSVSPANAASQAIIRGLGFALTGQQMDEVDGPEDIYELSAQEYRVRFLGGEAQVRPAGEPRIDP